VPAKNAQRQPKGQPIHHDTPVMFVRADGTVNPARRVALGGWTASPLQRSARSPEGACTLAASLQYTQGTMRFVVRAYCA
jgi:hypothetical protein